MLTVRESFYNLIDYKNKKKKEDIFFNIVKESLTKRIEIILPIQLFESIFEFDFHRGAKHPISSNIVKKFKKRGFRISKVRNYYLVRIKNKKEE